MLASLRTAAVFGVESCPVHVEVDVSFGLPLFTMVGLPDTSVRESRERVRLAIRNSGFEYPPYRITVNLSPADVRKAGAAFDLPIALGILAATGVVERRQIARQLKRPGGPHRMANETFGVIEASLVARLKHLSQGLTLLGIAICATGSLGEQGRPQRNPLRDSDALKEVF